jgi:hypothetical protein
LLNDCEEIHFMATYVTREDLAAPDTLAAYGYGAEEAQSIFDNTLPLQNYAALRAYSGRAIGVRITSAGIAGTFQRDDNDTVSADNDGTIIVDVSNRRWKRIFDDVMFAAWFGAGGDGEVDDTAALNGLTTAARALSKRAAGQPGATYKISDTVNINCNADFEGCTFMAPASLAVPAVKTSGTTAGGQIQFIGVKYPKVQNDRVFGDVPTAGSIGIQIEGARDCKFEFYTIRGFEENLQLYSNDGITGFISYNNHYFHEILFGGKINVHMKVESTGWINQCTWNGGQFAQISTDKAAFQTFNLQITKIGATGNNPPNGHTFIGCSMEGDFYRTIRYALDAGISTSYFSCNTWLNCRMENSKGMEFSSLALYDHFVNCLGANGATYTGSVMPNVTGGTRLFRYTMDIAAIPGAAGFRTAPSLAFFQASNTANAVALGAGISGQINVGLTAGGAFHTYHPTNPALLHPTSSVNTIGGTPKLSFGDGTAAPVDAIWYNNSADWRHSFSLSPSTDNARALGASTRRYSNIYSATFRPGAGAVAWTSGAGTPEGTVTAPVGSLYTRTDGAADTTLYVKETGAGSTGWVAK